MLKASIILVFIAWGTQAYEVSYQTQEQVYQGQPQVIVEQGQPQVTYEQLPPQVTYEQQPSQVVYQQQQPQVVYQQQPQVVYQQQQPAYVQQPQVLVPQGPVYVQPPAIAKNCPIACPYGWNKWLITKNCYLMPSQPLKPDNFWNSYRYCQSKEPTSYPFVINDLIEQALATGVALQYTPSYALSLSNLHVWLGGYVDRSGQWVMADGTKPNPLLMTTVKLVGGKNGTCISADPKTVGAWLPRPCSDDTGVTFCEMAPRPVCDGKTGGILPIGNLDIGSILKNPLSVLDGLKNPSLPIFGQLFGGGSLLGIQGDNKGDKGGAGGLLSAAGGLLG